ncbi:MAG: hypothetical protein F6J93_38430 [Oscillatoria sp. SIO1A7]|nr:hypothetical protein [Oscillatoria sp. SIO1A7]
MSGGKIQIGNAPEPIAFFAQYPIPLFPITQCPNAQFRSSQFPGASWQTIG